jgi:signal transduction histidine kinase
VLQTIPASALVLLNLILFIYAWRERERSPSAFFIALSSMMLILWASGAGLGRAFGPARWTTTMVMMPYILLPAIFLVYTLLRPSPLFKKINPLALTPFAVGPAVLVLAWDVLRRLDPQEDIGEPIPRLVYSSLGDMIVTEGWLVVAHAIVICGVSMWVLARRQLQARTALEERIGKYLFMPIASAVIFSMVFSTVSLVTPMVMVPGMGFLWIATLQISMLVVIRFEEIDRPLYLSRWIFYAIVILVGFILGSLIDTFWESVMGERLSLASARGALIGTMVVVFLIAHLPAIQSLFDRLLVRQAWEYRELVRAAQTELYETRERLRQAERLSVVGEMAARIAHEIKNPLGPIKGYTQMMLEKLDKCEGFPQRENFTRHLSIIAQEVENIDRKVRMLLGMARQSDLVLAPVNLNDIADRAAMLLRLEAEALAGDPGEQRHTIRIFDDFDSALPPVPCNRARIEEAISNLCRNAFEAVSDKGEVTLRTRATPGPDGAAGVVVRVEDNGPGFSDSARAHLFEPFFTERPGGTGLGLTIVKSHVEVHGGTITFTPRPGGGTIASIWLPLRPVEPILNAEAAQGEVHQPDDEAKEAMASSRNALS